MMSVARTLSHIEGAYARLTRRMAAATQRFLSFRAYINYRAGKKRYRERHYEGAKRHFLAVLRSNPRHFMTNVYLGRIYAKLENFPEASRRYGMAQEVDPLAYRRMDLIKEHVEALKLGAKRGMLRETLESVEKCGHLLTDLGQRIQDTIKKQQQSREGHPPPEKGRLLGKGTRRGVSPGQSPSGKVYPQKSDFLSFQEYKKFSEMPPISEEEFRDIDWDEILKDD